MPPALLTSLDPISCRKHGDDIFNSNRSPAGAMNYIPRQDLILQIPRELEDKIFSYAGPLSTWLCRLRRPTSAPPLSWPTRRFIWRDALQMSFTQLQLLPQYLPRVEDWCLVTDRSYYDFLIQYYGVRIDWVPPPSRSEDGFETGAYRCLSGVQLWPAVSPLHHIALSNVWTDLFVHREFRNATWRFGMAAYHGHENLMRHILVASVARRSSNPELNAVRPWTQDSEDIDLRRARFQHDGFDESERYMTGLECAIWGGHLEVVKEIVTFAGPEHSVRGALVMATRRGELAIVQFFHDAGRSDAFDAEIMDLAAYHGHIDIIQLLHFQRTEGCTPMALELAARQGHLDVVKFLVMNRSEGSTESALRMARLKGHAEIEAFLIKWAIEQNAQHATNLALL